MLCVVRQELVDEAQRQPQEDPELGPVIQQRQSLLSPVALAFLQRLMAVPSELQRWERAPVLCLLCPQCCCCCRMHSELAALVSVALRTRCTTAPASQALCSCAAKHAAASGHAVQATGGSRGVHAGRKGLLTEAFRRESPDKDREPRMSQLLLAIDAVLGEMERQGLQGMPAPESSEEQQVRRLMCCPDCCSPCAGV